MKVGIIGSGVVAQTLGAGFLKHGHQVALGTRDPAKLKDWAAKNKGAAVKSMSEAAAFGDVVVLAVAGQAALEALKLAGAAALAGKTVIDACNPIGGGPPVNGVLSYFTPQNELLMERLQKAYPAAHFVKAFNSVGHGQMINPHFAGGRPTMFICGDDAERKENRGADPRSVRLGDGGHGRGRGGARDRALVQALVHPRRRQGRLVGARVQALALIAVAPDRRRRRRLSATCSTDCAYKACAAPSSAARSFWASSSSV